jgi:hypothetical protein
MRFEEFKSKIELFNNIDAYISGNKEFPDNISDQYALMTAILMNYDKFDKDQFEKKVLILFDNKLMGMNEEIKALLHFNLLKMYKIKKNVKSVADLIIKTKLGGDITKLLQNYKYLVD